MTILLERFRTAARWSGLVICAAVVLTAGCGYHFAGREALPDHIRHIHIQVLENRTLETGIETPVTNALIAELSRRRTGLIVPSAGADAVMSGTIHSLGIDTISHTSAFVAGQRRVSLSVSLHLTATDGRVIWSADRISADEAYNVTNDDKEATNLNLRLAIDKVARRLAETVYRQLTNSF